MAEIEPFKPYYYNPDKVNIEDVVSEPYDKIDLASFQDYIKRSPYTFAKLLINFEWPVDKEVSGKYAKSNELYNKWIEERILLRKDQPSFFIYKQDFTYEDKEYTRLGFIGLCKLENFKKSIVLPHEFTLSKPKADRTEHLKTLHANMGQIFCLYEDPDYQLDDQFKSVFDQPPLYDFVDPTYFVKHKIWALEDQEIIEYVKSFMSEKQLLIADGHHRYETALEYSKNGGSPYVMMTMVNLYDKGLLILPTHRALNNISDDDLMDIIEKLRDDFLISRLGVETEEDKLKCIKKLKEVGSSGIHFGLYYGSNEFILLKYKRSSIANEAFGEIKSNSWRSLDVVVLHKAILKEYFGIDDEKLSAGSHVSYIRQVNKGFELVDKGGAQLIFFMNPTDLEKVFEVCKSGERMPQKSTDFYPKVLSGLAINSF